ncbi:hypothetical protein KAH27_05250 [bacterium]|nr:hypothetical protein [bacterium]
MIVLLTALVVFATYSNVSAALVSTTREMDNACVSNIHEKNITIVLVGDSTVTDDVGWGGAFAERLNDKVKTLNFAKKGSSSKSFYDLKYFVPALKAKPDYVFIQFGHNDQPGKGPDRETDPKDKTHLNKKGAEVIANLVVIDLKQVAPDLASYLKK